MKHRLFLLFTLVFLTMNTAAAQEMPRVLATTTILADVAQNVAGDLLTVETLVPADADTHAFEPSPSDVARVAEADLLLVVGAGYEAFLGDLIENAGSDAAQVVIVSNGIEILAFSEGEHEHDHEGETSDGEHDHEHIEVTDLSPWAGEHVSGYSMGVTAMQPAFDAILASTPELTQETLITYWDEGNGTSYGSMNVEGESITFSGAAGDVTCAYSYSGEQPIPQVEGEVWYVFETADAGCEAYRVLLLNPPHAVEEGATLHYHMRYGSASVEEVIADARPWYPSMYPAGTTAEQILPMWIANARATGMFVAASYGIEFAMTDDEMAMMQAEGEEAEGEHEHGAADPIGVLGEIECEAHDHEEDEAEAEHEDHSACDPHVWTDPINAVVWAGNIADALGAADPANAAMYRANADAYIAQLEAVDAEIVETLSVIPDEARILVTNHEFMGYFAAAYDFEVVGTVLPGGTTDAEPNPQELAALIELVQAESVPAIFAEVSANPQLAEVVAQEAGINVVTTLYSESLSAADGPASTYLDYLRYNAGVIAEALAG